MTRSFARVAVPRPVEDVFHYRIPDHLLGRIAPGHIVTAPFGKGTINGVVMEVLEKVPLKVRSILSVSPVLPVEDKLLELTRWTASYYQSPLGLIVRMCVPPPVRSQSSKFRLTEKGRSALNEDTAGPFGDLLAALKRGARTAAHLEKKFSSDEFERCLGEGLIEVSDSSPSGPVAGETGLKEPQYKKDEDTVHTLTLDQKRVLDSIEKSIDDGSFSVALLQGVTGSGKTEIYLRAAQKVMNMGQSVLLLVPEISLTPLLTFRLERIAQDRVAVVHSALTAAQKRSSWEDVREGRARLVVGVRSGVFVPIPDLGLIIVDEEHDASFRQEETPSYHARDVAVKRGQIQGIPVILGSATPSMESYRNSEVGKYRRLELPKRVTPYPAPKIEIVNMADPEVTRTENPFLSDRLMSVLKETVDGGSQAMLFLNRRGFSPFILCPDCNYTLPCPNCAVTLTYHRKRGMLCHYCGHLQPPPEACPNCQGIRMSPVGTGTQRLESAIASALPEAVIERLDRDIIVKKGALQDIYTRMDRSEIQVLVGTQIIAKGHDFPNVTLVGILNAEQALDFPDFRSSERTYQLITQVSGRAGRGTKKGRAIVQSYFPGHYSVSMALDGDYRDFYEAEASIRSSLGYPPFGRMGRVIVEGAKEETVQKACMDIARRHSGTKGIRILGPSSAPLPRILNRHRWHLLLLASDHSTLSKALRSTREKSYKSVRVHVRVDPYHLM